MNDRCACGHDVPGQHLDGPCICCLCPEPHDEVRMVPTLMNGRWELLLPSHRAYRREWTTPPYWEPERIAAMHDVINAAGLVRQGETNFSGHVVYDIGSEEADMAALWASWGADVVLVEPGPRVWPNARAIFDANDLTRRVRGWFVGFAGDEIRERPSWDAEHVHGGPEWGDAQAARFWPSCAYGPVVGDHGFCVIVERPDIPATTVDRLAELHGQPTVITIDVEGAELTVLRGAYRTLKEHRPRVYVSAHTDVQWMVEKFSGDEFEALDAYMRSLGYEGTHLATDHERHMAYAHPHGR